MHHATVNSGAKPARYLAWFTPPGREGLFAERAALIAGADGNPDPTQMDALRIRYGMVFADE